MPVDYSSMSTKEIERQAKDSRKRLESIKRQGDPGAGLKPAEAQKARDAVVAQARHAKAVASATKRELNSRAGEEKRSLRERLRGQPNIHERTAAAEVSRERLKKESREFNREIAKAMQEREAAEHARKVEAGLVYQPVGDGGGDAAAAVFSSASTWRAVKREIKDGRLAEPTLDGRTLVHLWHILNLLEEAGESITYQGRVPPGWPALDLGDPDGINFRDADLAHLAKNGYVAITREAGGVTVTYGPRTRHLVESFREHWRRAAA